MKADRIAHNKAKAKAALESGGSSFLDVEAIRRAVQTAKVRVSAIAEDARAYRRESHEKLRSISDEALRCSVDPSAGSRGSRSTTPTSVRED